MRGYPDLIMASLTAAAQRGVKVAVLLERGRGRGSDDKLDRDNVETGRRLQKKGVYVYLDAPQTTTHTKMVVVDGAYTFIGSHNLTQSALKYNHEISVLINSPQVAAEARSYINSIITTEGEPLTAKMPRIPSPLMGEGEGGGEK
jgi:phosphatidylserine/phosphatidylglycerophosphate/cardiolipin synthase-like enzyme